MPSLTPEERIGTLLAEKYRLERILGRGGMGVVFAGTHEWTERAVAVKLLHAHFSVDPTVAKRFLQEARTAGKIKHPNVVDVFDMGKDEGGDVYLVLEMLEHGQLSEGHGRALLGAPSTASMKKLARQAVSKGWSVRETERQVRAESRGGEAKAEKSKSANVRDLEQRLSRHLGAKVAVEDKKGKGKRQ